MSNPPGLRLFTTQLLNTPERLAGLEAFIRRNAAEAAIERLVILAEQLHPQDQGRLEALSPKLLLLPWPERPEFADLVEVARRHASPEGLTVITNSDIWFDLGGSDLASLLAAFAAFGGGLAFTCTRRDDAQPDRYLTVDGLLPELASADAWIVQGVPRPFPLRRVFLGSQDLERLVNEGLVLAGYRLANACSWLRAIHLEQSANDYHQFNLNQLSAATLANPLVAASGIPECRVVLPLAHGPFRGQPIHPERFVLRWEQVRRRWMVLDLAGASASDCTPALLWLLFLAKTHDRHLLCCVDEATDPALVELLDRFHGLTGRSLCLRGFPLEALLEQASAEAAGGDLCWVASPAGIGPQLLAQPMPIFCLRAAELRPIKGSWLFHYSPASLCEQIQALNMVPPLQVAELLASHSIHWFHIQLLSCTYKAEEWLPGFLAQSIGWIHTTGAYGYEVLHSFCEAAPALATRRQIAAALAERQGVFLLLERDPGLYGCWNTLMALSEEEFVSNANPDDRRSPDHLGVLVEQLRAHPERLVASSAVVPIQRKIDLDNDFAVLQQACRAPWFADAEDGYGLSALTRPLADGRLEPHNIPHCSPVWRRQVHERHGWFDEQRYGSEADWALWCCYGYHGGQFCHVREPLSGYFVNPGSYGRSQALSAGRRRIERDFFSAPSLPESTPPLPELPQPRPEPPQPLQVRIHGLDAYYGEHRFSNNQILACIDDLHHDKAPLRFIWFLERYFLWGDSPGERCSWDFSPIREHWVGVLHVPPLTPKWAGNQFSELHFLPEWRQSLEKCRALIALSDYMAADLRALYPAISVYSLLHPVQPFGCRFSWAALEADPKVVLVGYWLRRHHQFYRWRAPLPKLHLLKRYSAELMERELEAIGQLSRQERSSVQQRHFLPAEQFDALLSSSIVYLGLYETSGNNAVTECIAMGTPFIADRHPAIEEYVGADYPLLMAPGELESLGRAELLERARLAHRQLVERPELLERLNYRAFRRSLAAILETC